MMRLAGALGLAIGALLAPACTWIPAAPLETYLTTFKQARDATEEVLLRARVEAQWVAATPLNQRDPAKRDADLKARLGALDAMFVCLEVMDRYNDLLARLATPGHSQQAIQSDIDQLGAALSALNQSWLNRLVERVPMYGPIIAQGIEIIDDLIRKQRFAEAVDAAASPMGTITRLLSDNVQTIGEVASLRSELEVFEIETRMDALHQDVTAGLEGWSITTQSSGDEALAAAAARFIKAAKAVDASYGVLPSGPAPVGAAAPGFADLAAASVWLAGQAERAETLAREQDQALAQKAAFERVVAETSDLLGQTGSYFNAMRRAIKESRAEATIDLGLRIMRLREALRALDQTEQQSR
jgi:hypothetical protein